MIYGTDEAPNAKCTLKVTACFNRCCADSRRRLAASTHVQHEQTC